MNIEITAAVAAKIDKNIDILINNKNLFKFRTTKIFSKYSLNLNIILVF